MFNNFIHNLASNRFLFVFLSLSMLTTMFLTKPLYATPPSQDGTGAGTVIYLPLIANYSGTNPPTATPPNGEEKILDAGFLSSATAPARNEPTSPQVVLDPEPGNSPVKEIVCSVQDWQVAEVRDLQDRLFLNPSSGVIYPGALLQGKNLEDGSFTPLTIQRSGGTIWLQGLQFKPQARYSATLSEITGSNIQQAIQDILAQEVEGTAANASLTMDKTSSYEHMLFKLGIDARYGIGKMESDLSIDHTKKRSHVFMKFTQVFYDVIYEDPALSTSVFRDGAAFTDVENQIGVGNPPLYVQKVSYGRMIFLVAESEYEAEDVEATLKAAMDIGIFGGEVRTGVTHEDVLSHTKMYYYVVGGSADLALEPLKSSNPQTVFETVHKLVANPNAANFSASNPGLPVAYTLRYLQNRDVARMSYSLAYQNRDCKTHLYPSAEVTILFPAVKIIDDSDDLGSGEIHFDFEAYVDAEKVDTDHFPATGNKEMDSGSTYPVESGLKVTITEGQRLRIYAYGHEDDEDNYGTATIEWGDDQLWGQYPVNAYYIAGKGAGEFRMHYKISVKWIRPPATPPLSAIGPFGGEWGDWHDMEYCNKNTYAVGMALSVEGLQDGDDTALNGIRLLCGTRGGQITANQITSGLMGWGKWSEVQRCPGSYIVAARLRLEPKQYDDDDTGAVDAQFQCANGTILSTPPNLGWGSWMPWQTCPEGRAIAGIKTRVEARQGDEDDTALNDAVFDCRPLE